MLAHSWLQRRASHSFTSAHRPAGGHGGARPGQRRDRGLAHVEPSLAGQQFQPPPGADGDPGVQKKARGRPGTCSEAGAGMVESWPAAWRRQPQRCTDCPAGNQTLPC